MGIFDKALDIAGSALNLPPPEDSTLEEKELELKLLKMRMERKETAEKSEKELAEQKKKEGKNDEKGKVKRPDKVPMMAKELIHYPVYLVLPDDDTRHTRLIHFKNSDGVVYYFLEWNNRIYTQSEIKNFGEANKKSGVDGNLDKQSSNILFIDNEGALTIGQLKFTPAAEKIIKQTDNLKMENRTFERIIRSNKIKFGSRPLEILFYIAIVGVMTMLLLWATFDGVTKVLAIQGGEARQAWITQHTPIELNISSFGGNQTAQQGIGNKLDKT